MTTPNVTFPATGAPLLASNALPNGTRVHEFEITRVIGEGGFSIVYLAFDHTLHRSIALKEYIPSALASRRGDQTVAVRSAQHQQTFEAGLRSFINESRLLAQFDHPALVKVFRFWEANGTAYMAMPFYEGRTLKQILREHPEQASEAWLKRLLVPLLDALTLLHAHQCYHRDIAPDNIQVLDNEAPVLLDFGAARRTIGDMTQAFTVILKPGYAPIEQYAEEMDLKQGPWTDVYALSALLYAAIVGRPPPTAVARVIKDPLEPLAARGAPGFDEQFLAGIDCGLAVRPEARPQSIAAWRGLLGMDQSDPEIRARTTPPVGSSASSTAWAQRTRRPPQHPAASAKDAMAGDASSEADRTVLVSGLRRSLQPPRTENTGATDSTAPTTVIATSPTQPRNVEPPRTQVLAGTTSHLARIVAALALVALIAVAAWLGIAGPSGERAAEPVIAKGGDDAKRSSPSAEPAPARADATAPSSVSPQSASPSQQSPTQSLPPRTSSPPSPTPSPPSPTPSPPPSPPPPAQAQLPRAQTPPQAQPSAQRPTPTGTGQERRIDAAPRDAAGTPSPAKEAKPPPAKPRPAPVPEDERRWAAISNGDNIEDLRVFRDRFPQSRHAQEAAVRIQQLVRQSRESAREATGSTPQPEARASNAKTAQAAGSARPGMPADTAVAPGKGSVRIRVQPFGYVYVDGALVGPSPPVREVQLSPGRHQIEARNDQENPPVVRKEIDVDASGSTEVPLRFGQ